MKLITKREVIKRVAERWLNQYTQFKRHSGEKQDTYKRLLQLVLDTATEDDVEKVIGNRSWTRMACDQCEQEVDTLVQVGQEPDYESRTASLCPTCLRAAVALLPS